MPMAQERPYSPQHWGAGGAVAALRSPDPALRAAALDWLGERTPETLGAEEAAALRDPVPLVRAAAAVAFRGAADPALVGRARLALRALVEGDAEERHAGLRAAARLANPTLAPRLLPFLAHPEPETRRLTLLALAAVPPGLLGPAFLREHAGSLLGDADTGVRAAAEAILAGGEGE